MQSAAAATRVNANGEVTGTVEFVERRSVTVEFVERRSVSPQRANYASTVDTAQKAAPLSSKRDVAPVISSNSRNKEEKPMAMQGASKT